MMLPVNHNWNEFPTKIKPNKNLMEKYVPDNQNVDFDK